MNEYEKKKAHYKNLVFNLLDDLCSIELIMTRAIEHGNISDEVSKEIFDITTLANKHTMLSIPKIERNKEDPLGYDHDELMNY